MMIVNEQNPATQLVFKSITGTKVFGFKDLTQISAFRGVAAEEAKRIASLCLTKQVLTELLEEQKQAFNKQDFAKAVAIGIELQFRNNMICEENSLLDLAYIYLMLEGEDLEKPSKEYNKKKAELIIEQSDLKGFFLREALQLAESFSQRQDADLLNYLEETKGLLLKLSKFSSSHPKY
jgi:hypothetical protein